MIKVYEPDKMQDALYGPYQISEIRTNGTVRVRRDPTGFVEETFNIRKIEPFKGQLQPQHNPDQIQNLFNAQIVLYNCYVC